MKFQVSHSQLETFRACVQKWAFRYREGLRPIAQDAEPLRRGTLYHQAMKVAYDAWINGASLTLVLNAIEDIEWPVEADVEMVQLVTAMAKLSMEEIMVEDTSAGIVPLAAEVPFEIAVRDPKGRKVPGATIRGIIDAISLDKPRGLLVIGEHKATKNHIESIESRIPFDPQASTYVDAASHLLKSGALSAALWRHGFEVPAAVGVGPVVYNVARAVVPRAPTVNKDGSVSVAQIDTLPKLYADALAAQAQPDWFTKAYESGSQKKIDAANDRLAKLHEKQQALLDSLESNEGSFFGRFEHFRSPQEMEDWRADLLKDTKRVRLALQREDEVTRNPGNCSMPWSMSCEYSSVCLDRHDATIREKLFTTPEQREQAKVAAAAEAAAAAKQNNDDFPF